MGAVPNFELVETALETALAALPLSAADGLCAEVRQEYVAITLFILQSKERVALFHRTWAAKGHPMETLDTPAPLDRRQPVRDCGTA